MTSTLRTIASAGMAAGLIAATALALWTDGTASSTPAGTVQAPRITVEAGASRVVCPADLKLPGSEDGEGVSYDPQFDPAPTAVTSQLTAVVEGAYGGDVAPLGADQATELPGPVSVWTGQAGTDPVVANARAVTGFSPLTGGGVLIESVGGDLGGLAGASCLAPRSESYIVGGSTQVGSATRLVMVNPGATPATVDLTLWGPSGRVDAVGGTGLILPPRAQRVALLEGMIGGAGRLAVKVSASGGEIAAYLQHSRLDGLTPAGVDFAVPGAPPDTSAVVPGIVALPTTVESTDPTVVRLLVTGREDAVASIAIHGPDGQVEVPGTVDIPLVAGEVMDVPLLGLAEGTYTATVTSSRPIVAAAMSTRFGAAPGSPREIAWSASGAAPAQGFLAVFGQTVSLTVGGAGDASLRLQAVTPQGEFGPETQVVVPAG
ncbi:MAG: DUF5719 family protein, partial [Bifidobacteriaceae bacterium]|nr:DUF5719 family protein [Bifidobacteriaceae bacterium]